MSPVSQFPSLRDDCAFDFKHYNFPSLVYFLMFYQQNHSLTFCVWPLSLNIIFMRVMYVVAEIRSPSTYTAV